MRRVRWGIDSQKQLGLSRGWPRATARTFRMSGQVPKERHDLDGRNHNRSRLQVKAARASSERPTAAWTECDDGFYGSFRGAYAANETWRLDFRSSAGPVAARQTYLHRVRAGPSDDDQD